LELANYGACALFAVACRPFFTTNLTNSPTAPIWNIFNGVEFLLEKNVIATKMKENGCVVDIL
jgi:hypothetical protein